MSAPWLMWVSRMRKLNSALQRTQSYQRFSLLSMEYIRIKLYMLYPREDNPNFPWEKSHWDYTAVKIFSFKSK